MQERLQVEPYGDGFVGDGYLRDYVGEDFLVDERVRLGQNRFRDEVSDIVEERHVDALASAFMQPSPFSASVEVSSEPFCRRSRWCRCMPARSGRKPAFQLGDTGSLGLCADSLKYLVY